MRIFYFEIGNLYIGMLIALGGNDQVAMLMLHSYVVPGAISGRNPKLFALGEIDAIISYPGIAKGKDFS